MEYSEKFLKDIIFSIGTYSRDSLDIGMMEVLRDFLDWRSVSRYCKLSEEVISHFKDYVYWDYICKYQVLSEEFIDQHEAYIQWENLFIYQALSAEYRKKRMLPSEYLFATDVFKHIGTRNHIIIRQNSGRIFCSYARSWYNNIDEAVFMYNARAPELYNTLLGIQKKYA